MYAAAVHTFNDADVWIGQAPERLAPPARHPYSFSSPLHAYARPAALDVVSVLQQYRQRLDTKPCAPDVPDVPAASSTVKPRATRSGASSPSPPKFRASRRPSADATPQRPLSAGCLATSAQPQSRTSRDASPQERPLLGHPDGTRTLDMPQAQRGGVTLGAQSLAARAAPALKLSKSRIWRRSRAPPANEQSEEEWESGSGSAGPALAPNCFDEMMANLLSRALPSVG